MPALYRFELWMVRWGSLPRHENMIAVLAADEVKVKRIDDENHVNWIAVNGGVIELPIMPSPLLLISRTCS